MNKFRYLNRRMFKGRKFPSMVRYVTHHEYDSDLVSFIYLGGTGNYHHSHEYTSSRKAFIAWRGEEVTL